MNNDRRRILGPQNAKVPSVAAKDNMDISSTKPANEIQKIFLKTNFISNANGSAYIEHGDSIVQVSVFGPRPIKSSFIEQASCSVECKFLPHLVQDPKLALDANDQANPNGRTGLGYTEHKISSFLESSLVPSILLEKYPKLAIDLHVTVIEHNHETTSLSNLVSWMVVACSLALVDSGIEIRDIVTAGNVVIDNGDVILDPQEPVDKQTECLVSFMNLKNEMVGIWIDGELDNVELAIDQCNKMSKIIRSNVNSYLLSI